MEKKIVFTPVEPNKNLLWLHYKNGLLVLQRFGSKGWEDITNSDQITEAEVRELIKDKANLVGGKVPAEELPSYVDDVIEFNNIQVADAEISSIIGNNLYKNQIRFINNSTTLPDRIGSEDKYPDMFVNFGENTSEDDWTTFEPEQGKIYINTTNNHSYRWSGSQLIDLDKSWSQGIEDLQENTIRTDISQDFSTEEENQALSNIGSGLLVVNLVNGQATLTEDQEAKLLSSSGVILRGTVNAGKEVLTKIYFADYQEGTVVSFYAIRNNRYILRCDYDKQTKIFRFASSVDYIDPSAVSIKSQTLTNAQQDVALSNIGLKWVNVPYSLLNTTLDDATYAKIKNANGLILTDAPSEYYGPLEFICGANNSDGVKVFTNLNLADTSAYIILYTNHSLTNVRYLRTYNGAVPYDTSKTLTLDQQDVALSNIGLNFVHVDYSLLGTTLTDEMFAVLNNAKGIILVDLPSNYYNPFVFIKGNNTSKGCVFVGFATGTMYCQIKLNKSTKILSNINANLTYIGTVRYIEKQSLTDTQKDTVLSNIGLGFILLDYSLLGTTLDDSTAALVENANGLILFNAPNNERPVILPRCSFTNNVAYFNSWRGVSLVDQITYNVNTKALSAIWSTEVPINSVKYNGVQNLTDTQKQQARTNIGVKSADELLEDADFIAQLKTKLETV